MNYAEYLKQRKLSTDLKEILKEIKTIVPSTQYNETFESLQELYKLDQSILDKDEEALEKLKQYNPSLFPDTSECVNKHCTLLQMYPRLFNYKFRQTTNMQFIKSQSTKYYLFNVFTNIRTGKLYQNAVNIQGVQPIPDNEQPLFIECQSADWIVMKINEQYPHTKVGLYYDDWHIILAESSFTEQQIQELTELQIDFNPDILTFQRYLDFLPSTTIHTAESTDTQIDLGLFFRINNIPPLLEEALRKIFERKNDVSTISNVGEGLRLQKKIMSLWK